MKAIFNKVMLYAKNIEKTARFYKKYFGFKGDHQNGGLIELTSPDSGMAILIHQAGKGIKMGQVCVKLVFDVKNIEQFKTKSRTAGLNFGVIHMADGYSYTNAKDPDKNSIQITSRSFRKC